MSKTIQLSDRQYEWFAARARGGQTISVVINHLISLLERYEADLEKYQKWADASNSGNEAKHETLPLE